MSPGRRSYIGDTLWTIFLFTKPGHARVVASIDACPEWPATSPGKHQRELGYVERCLERGTAGWRAHYVVGYKHGDEPAVGVAFHSLFCLRRRDAVDELVSYHHREATVQCDSAE